STGVCVCTLCPCICFLLSFYIRCIFSLCFIFFNDTSTTVIYTLSLHDALPICSIATLTTGLVRILGTFSMFSFFANDILEERERSEEHTSELQSPDHLVCRLLLEKKKNKTKIIQTQVPHKTVAYTPSIYTQTT